MTSHHGQTVSCWMNLKGATDDGPLRADAQADVCIIGGGIAGLTTAYFLTLAGKSVILLDQAHIGGGETERTTAHLSNAIDDRYFHVERVRGNDGARLAAESHTAAIDLIESIVNQEQIDCTFQRLDGFLILGAGQTPDVLRRERDAAQRAGLSQVELVADARLGERKELPALRFPRQGTFHPLKYLQGLARCIRQRGGKIHSQTPVDEIAGGTPGQVRTKDGRQVTCDAIVVATNTPINDIVTIHAKQAAYRTYAIAARIPRGSVSSTLWWDTEDPYHYVRIHPQQDGSDTDLLIIGGEDHKTGQDSLTADHFASLESWARGLFPQLGAVVNRWSGQVLETMDGLAYIGRNPGDQPNVFVATGDSGMGMTHGTIAGFLLTELIHGREHPWATLYDPSRKPLLAAAEAARENANAAWQYTDWFRKGEVASAEEIPPGSGALIRRGLRQIAVYRGEDNTVHECSAACPHMGCIVHWNDVEKSWDCPCHGSRFSPEGEVMNGPAITNLTALPAQEHSAPVGGS